MKPYYKMSWAAAEVALSEHKGEGGVKPVYSDQMTGYVHEWIYYDDYVGLDEDRKRELRKPYREGDDRVYNKILSIAQEMASEGFRTSKINRSRCLRAYARYIKYLQAGDNARVEAILKEADIAVKNRRGYKERLKDEVRTRKVRANILLHHPRLEHIYRRLFLMGGPAEPDAQMLFIMEESLGGAIRRKVSLIPKDRKACEDLIDWLHDYADKYHPKRGRPANAGDIDDDIDHANALLDAEECGPDEEGDDSIEVDI